MRKIGYTNTNLPFKTKLSKQEANTPIVVIHFQDIRTLGTLSEDPCSSNGTRTCLVFQGWNEEENTFRISEKE